MLKIRNLRDDEIRQRLLAIGKDQLAETLLELARQHPRNGRLVEYLLNYFAAAYEATLATSTGLPAGEPGMDSLALLRLQVASLQDDRAPLPAEHLEGFGAELLKLLERIASAEIDDDEALELAGGVLDSFDNMQHRSGKLWPQLFRMYAAPSKALLATLLRRSQDAELRREILLERLAAADLPEDDGYVALAVELLEEQQLRKLISELTGGGTGRRGFYAQYVLYSTAAILARGLGDAALFEKLTLEAADENGDDSGEDEPPEDLRSLAQVVIMEVAEVYLECGRPRAALARMELMYEVTAYRSDESEALFELIRRAVDSETG